MSVEDIDSSYPIDRLTAVLDNARPTASVCDGGFLSLLDIPDQILNEKDIRILCEFMRAEITTDYGLAIVLRGNDKLPIVFAEKDDAVLSASQQVPNLGKQLMFSVFRKTGVKFSIGAQSFNPGEN